MSDDGKVEIAELSKDNSPILTLDEAVNVVDGLLLQLQWNGYMLATCKNKSWQHLYHD